MDRDFPFPLILLEIRLQVGHHHPLLLPQVLMVPSWIHLPLRSPSFVGLVVVFPPKQFVLLPGLKVPLPILQQVAPIVFPLVEVRFFLLI